MMRLRQAVLCMFCLLLLSNLYGQTNRMDFGLEGGIGRAYLRGTAVKREIYKPTTGFMGGVFFQFNLKKIFSLRTIFAYERKGSGSAVTLTDQYGRAIYQYTIKQNLNYATSAVLLRATFGKKFRFFLNFGPYVAYLLNYPYKSAYPASATGLTSFKKFDFGLTSGLGFSLPLGAKISVGLEIRHNLGLYDIAPVSRYGTDGTVKTNSTNLILSFARKFGFRK